MKLTQEIKRKLIQIAAFGFSNASLGNFVSGKLYKGPWKQFCSPGMNCYSCPAARFACPIGALQAVNGSMNFSFSFYAAGLILAFGVLLGRAICGFLCPFGLVQELIHKIPSPKIKLPKAWKYVKYVLLAVFVLILPIVRTDGLGVGAPAFCQYICPIGTLEGGIPLMLTHPELRAALGWLFSWKMAVLIATLIGCVLAERFFCKVMCPLGAVYGLLNRVSLYALKVDHSLCIACGKCQKDCPMDVDPVQEPDSPECIRCGKCAAGCPKNAITIGFCRKK